MAKSNDLLKTLRKRGLRKGIARAVTDVTRGRKKPGGRLATAGETIRARVFDRGTNRESAAKKAAATRRRNAAKRSAAARRGAATRKARAGR